MSSSTVPCVKSEKVRVACEATSKNKGKPLNLLLCRRPDSLNSLIGVLPRFGNNNTIIVANVEGMFHQVRVKPSDYDSQRLYGQTHPRKFKGRNISNASTHLQSNRLSMLCKLCYQKSSKRHFRKL